MCVCDASTTGVVSSRRLPTRPSRLLRAQHGVLALLLVLALRLVLVVALMLLLLLLLVLVLAPPVSPALVSLSPAVRWEAECRRVVTSRSLPQ
jgi:hypothetical protein